ncbi:MAG: ATP-binding protein [Lentilitoribacter sp.]
MNYDGRNARELGLLERLEEDSFSHLTELASNVLNTPVALISIIDNINNRQFFTSMHGLQDPWSSRGETPLSHSFCKYVAIDDEPLIVENSLTDKRVRDNPAVKDLNVKAYLGVPVHDLHDRAIGALCAIDTSPRKWSDDDINTMTKLGKCVDDAIRLRSALKSSEEVREEQADFTYAMSHDIKAPIFTLKTLLTELGPLFEDKNAADHSLFLQKALQTTQRMEQKTADILQYAYMGRDRNQVEDVDLNDIASVVLEDLSGLVTKTNAVIDLDTLPVIYANKKYMRLLFQNLLTNALKFQPHGQRPKISICSTNDVYEDVIKISDNGIGVDEKYQDQIFKLFGRLHTHKDFPGTGLGLALSAKIVSYMNGEISIQSKLGEGTTFSVTLPKHHLTTAIQS